MLNDDEFEKYKLYLEIAEAERLFEEYYPEMKDSDYRRFTTEEFAEVYLQKDALIIEIGKWRDMKRKERLQVLALAGESEGTLELKMNHMAGELSDPEVNEFLEFLHTGYEIGLEDKLHGLSTMG